MRAVMDILHLRQGKRRYQSGAAGHDKNQSKTDPCERMVLPETEEPACRTERHETKTRHDRRPPCEIGAPLMLVEVIGDEAVPGRHGELATGEVKGGAANDKPRSGGRKEKRQEDNWDPSEGLTDCAYADQCFSVAKQS